MPFCVGMAQTASGGMIMGCMCAECRFAKVIEDEQGKLFSVCANRKSDNFLTELEIAFDNCEIGMVDDEEE